MNTLHRLALTFLLAFSACLHTPAQTPLVWDSHFDLPRQFNGPVLAIAETADAFYYGGSFTHVGTVAASNVVRVDKTTGAVTPLGSTAGNGVSGVVRVMVVSGTDLFVGGTFIKVSDATTANRSANRIAKWSTTEEKWSPLGSATQNGTGWPVSALAVSGTDLFVGGEFATVSDENMANRSANNIAKWSTTNRQWSPLGTSTQNGTNNDVNALAVMGGELFVGGGFTAVGDENMVNRSANNIAQWSVTTSQWTPLGTPTQNGVSGTVWALAVSGTDLLIGGDFNAVSDASMADRSANHIAKWSTTNSQWSLLGAESFQNGTEGPVYALAFSGNDLFVGGFFGSVNDEHQSIFANRIAKWSFTTSQWSTLGSPDQQGTDHNVYAIAVSGAALFVGGFFATVSDSIQANNLLKNAAKWNIANSQWERVISDETIRIGIDSGVVKAVLDAGPVIYVGGSFTQVGNVRANNVASLNKATGLWSPLGSPTQNGTSGMVHALAVSGTDLFVGGQFTTVSGGRAANRIAKWSTTTEQWSPLGTPTQNGMDSNVYALAVRGTDLFVAGEFDWVRDVSSSSISANGIAKWSTTAERWSPLGNPAQNGMDGSVFTLAVSGTDLFVGGFFTTVRDVSSSSISANNTAKWSMTTERWSPLGIATQNGTDYSVSALAVSGTDLFVGGRFDTVRDVSSSSISANGIAKWSTTAQRWSPLGNPTQNGPPGTVDALAVNGSDLFVGGPFLGLGHSASGGFPNYIAKWSTATSQWSPLGSATQNGMNGRVEALARVVRGNEVYLIAGGFFTTVSSSTQNSIPSHHIASAFLNKETAGKPYHDYAIVLRDYYTSIGQANLSLAWFYYYESLGFYFDFMEAGDSPSAALHYYLYGSYFYYHYCVDAGYPATALYILYNWQGLAYAAYFQGLGYNDAAAYYYTLYLGYANSAYAYYTSLGSR